MEGILQLLIGNDKRLQGLLDGARTNQLASLTVRKLINPFKLKEEIQKLVMEERSNIVIITECDFESKDIALVFKIDGYSTVILKKLWEENKDNYINCKQYKIQRNWFFSYFPFTWIEIQRENQGNLNIIGIFYQI